MSIRISKGYSNEKIINNYIYRIVINGYSEYIVIDASIGCNGNSNFNIGYSTMRLLTKSQKSNF